MIEPGRYKSKINGGIFSTIDGVNWVWVSGENKGLRGPFGPFKNEPRWLKGYTKLSFSFKEYTKLLR